MAWLPGRVGTVCRAGSTSGWSPQAATADTTASRTAMDTNCAVSGMLRGRRGDSGQPARDGADAADGVHGVEHRAAVLLLDGDRLGVHRHGRTPSALTVRLPRRRTSSPPAWLPASAPSSLSNTGFGQIFGVRRW
ncbi:hypothetical protein SBI_00400 [Streptomyces bingchenggensis BCW-1]|uniref:Uncharacterized protein n=1 Tax=Streptomyces bingchenggensis (strain BCW-1) TaxID=749414 RepID=D7BYJ3_STRBB|nr:MULTISPECIES: hypothetical protein [Streptomyces]ADI03521.1 hypothetical protein SBI_00400 [Streptomyces bingchenggensis BCW-1]